MLAANLLLNGDFSENSVAGRWDIFYYGKTDDIPAAESNEVPFVGWDISGPVELWGSDWDGWVELDADQNGPSSRWDDATNPGLNPAREELTGDEKGSTSISQTVAVESGKTYALSFDFKGRSGRGIAENMLDVSVSGVTTFATQQFKRASNEVGRETVYFTATSSGNVTVTFEDAGIDNTYGTLIKDIELLEVDLLTNDISVAVTGEEVNQNPFVLREGPSLNVDDGAETITGSASFVQLEKVKIAVTLDHEIVDSGNFQAEDFILYIEAAGIVDYWQDAMGTTPYSLPNQISFADGGLYWTSPHAFELEFYIETGASDFSISGFVETTSPFVEEGIQYEAGQLIGKAADFNIDLAELGNKYLTEPGGKLAGSQFAKWLEKNPFKEARELIQFELAFNPALTALEEANLNELLTSLEDAKTQAEAKFTEVAQEKIGGMFLLSIRTSNWVQEKIGYEAPNGGGNGGGNPGGGEEDNPIITFTKDLTRDLDDFIEKVKNSGTLQDLYGIATDGGNIHYSFSADINNDNSQFKDDLAWALQGAKQGNLNGFLDLLKDPHNYLVGFKAERDFEVFGKTGTLSADFQFLASNLDSTDNFTDFTVFKQSKVAWDISFPWKTKTSQGTLKLGGVYDGVNDSDPSTPAFGITVDVTW